MGPNWSLRKENEYITKQAIKWSEIGWTSRERPQLTEKTKAKEQGTGIKNCISIVTLPTVTGKD